MSRGRIGFLVDRLTYFKLYGPIVEDALAAGLEVVLLLKDSAPYRTGPKGYQWADPLQVPAFANGRPDVRQWESDAALVALARRERLDAVVSVWLYPREYALCRALREVGVRWIALQHGIDYLVKPIASLAEPDVTCMFSTFWIERAIAFFTRAHAHDGDGGVPGMLRARLRATGFPELDALRSLDPDAVRARFGIPPGRPVVVWLPHDHHERDLWEMLVYRRRWWDPRVLARAVRARRWDLVGRLRDGVGERTVAESLRAFCDRNGAFLLVKSRIKDRPSASDRRVADLFTFDRSYHPPTILESLVIADLCVHVLSVASMEAAYAGVPGLCLIPPEASAFVSDPDTAWRRTSDDVLGPGTLWNFAGVSTTLTMAEAVERLPQMSLADLRLDAMARDEYVRRYVGPVDGRSARRVLEAALGDRLASTPV